MIKIPTDAEILNIVPCTKTIKKDILREIKRPNTYLRLRYFYSFNCYPTNFFSVILHNNKNGYYQVLWRNDNPTCKIISETLQGLIYSPAQKRIIFEGDFPDHLAEITKEEFYLKYLVEIL
jgi:hypothetical protein